MYICKNCHEKLTKFDKDLCPYCGTKNPLIDDGNSSDTTKTIDVVKSEDINFHEKSNLTFNLLLMFLGTFGIDQFYIGNIKTALIRLSINIVFYFVIFILIFVINKNLVLLASLLPLGILLIFYLVLGIISLLNGRRVKDSNGVYLK